MAVFGLRFIPASAGNIAHAAARSSFSAVHPRECGEHGINYYAIDNGFGSSPRVRGTWVIRPLTYQQKRFIPASAGNMLSALTTPLFPPVHPRECGEHYPLGVVAAAFHGSSPRVRGTSTTGQAGTSFGRFIPASAGNISPPSTWFTAVTVHPRECGEHTAGSHGMYFRGGSSPRVRGTSGRRAKTSGYWRFIPASAGNILRSYMSLSRGTVHPRECGEHCSLSADFSGLFGSSPRVRGTCMSVA